MVCKFQEINDFFNKYSQLLENIKEEELKELLETFPHACKFVKMLDEDNVNCDNLEEVSQKTLELLNNAYDHEYTKDDILNFATAVCKMFDIIGAPKYHVPFILVMLAKL